MENFIGVSEAAKLLGVSERQARHLAKLGKLKAIHVGRAWVFKAKDVHSASLIRRKSRPRKRLRKAAK